MDDYVGGILSGVARWRLFRYLNCAQASFRTLVGYLDVPDRTAVTAICPLEGGAASEGSTCGVVTGGCLSICLGHLADILSGEGGKGEGIYERMREYTGWFEEEFGSTLCRERCGVDVKKVSGFIDYIFTGKVISRCAVHIGKSAAHLVKVVDQPIQGDGEFSNVDRMLSERGGYCASEVMRGIRGETGYGSLYLEQICTAFDGGIGLSGGLCGALAGALMPIGLVWGINPEQAGLAGTLSAFLKGHINLYMGRDRPELWAVANPLVRSFEKKFGSKECGNITGRSFGSGSELEAFMEGTSICKEVKEWCRERAVELISANKNFDA